jgi:hypothetical protein
LSSINYFFAATVVDVVEVEVVEEAVAAAPFAEVGALAGAEDVDAAVGV